MMDDLSDEALRTCLKHLHVRRDNFSRTRDATVDPSARKRAQTEIDSLTEVIEFFETVRSERGI